MVEIKYCAECQKAKREHFKKSPSCSFCGSKWESIDVGRSGYFAIMLPMVVMGFILHMWALWGYVSNMNNPDELASQKYFLIGLFFFGITFYFIAIMFQILDSKKMEKGAQKLGIRYHTGAGLDPGKFDSPIRMATEDKEIPIRRPTAGKKKETPTETGGRKSPYTAEEEEPVEEEKPKKKDIPIRKPKTKEEDKEEKGEDKEEKGEDKEEKGEDKEEEEEDKEEEEEDKDDKKKEKKKGKKKGKKKKEKKEREEHTRPPRKMARKIRTR